MDVRRAVSQADSRAEEFVACALAICPQPDRYHFREVNENEIGGIALNTGAEGGEIGLKSLISDRDFGTAGEEPSSRSTCEPVANFDDRLPWPAPVGVNILSRDI